MSRIHAYKKQAKYYCLNCDKISYMSFRVAILLLKKKKKIFIDASLFWFCHITAISHILLNYIKSASNVFYDFCLKEFINYSKIIVFRLYWNYVILQNKKLNYFQAFCTLNFNMTKTQRFLLSWSKTILPSIWSTCV